MNTLSNNSPVVDGAQDGSAPSPTPARGSVWARTGSFSYRRRRLVLALWVLALVGIGVASGVIGPRSNSGFDTPDSDSSQGFEILKEKFGLDGSQLSGSIVFKADSGITEPAVVAVIDEFLGGIETELEDGDEFSVGNPFATGPGPGAGAVSADETVAYAEVNFTSSVNETRSAEIGAELLDRVPELEAALTAAGAQGAQVELGGQALGEFEPPKSELIGLAFAIIVLILAFGSVLAMGLPIGVALFGVGIGIMLINLLSNVMSIPDFAITLAAMIGLGVGIDYALFIVNRYRSGLRLGLSRHDALVESIDTSGRAVIFAGFTVVISLLGMFAMGLSFINGLATGAAVTVLVTMVASITLLPALIGFAGERVEITRWRGLLMAAGAAIALFGVGVGFSAAALAGVGILVVSLLLSFVWPKLRQHVPHRVEKPFDQTLSYRWSHFVQRRPWPVAIGVSAILVLLTLPVFGMRLGFSDESTFPEDSTTKQAYDLLTDGFGAGSNGPLIVAAELAGPEQLATGQAVADAIAATPGVDQVLGPIPSQQQDAFIIRVVPDTGPQDEATYDLVKNLRDDVIPTAVGDSGLDVVVTGSVASSVDFTSYLGGRLPLFFIAVLTLSFLLLMMVFRSVLVPLKAVVMNLLSIGASYGIVVAVFQWGWGIDLFGSSTGPIEPFLPMMLFAIVFGLSMDYEVFLLSRVREEFDRTGDPVNSVADGLASTARVISAAAAIMVVVFGAFLLEDNRVIKLFGLGLSVAVLLDATLVRMLLVPATMELLGAKNWWLPKWLDRILPQLTIEGSHHTAPVGADGSAAMAGGGSKGDDDIDDVDDETRSPQLV